MTYLPITLKIFNQRCLVIGAGDIADAKARLIAATGADVVRLATSTEIANTDINGRLAFIVPDPADDLPAMIAKLHHLGYLVNVADRPDLCDFLLPAFVDRAPVIVAISTGGQSATVARQVRTAIEAMLPASLGAKVAHIAEARPLVAKHLDTANARRRFWDKATRPGAWGDPLSNGALPTLSDIEAEARGQNSVTSKNLCVVMVQSRDPDDLSVVCLRQLQRADLVITLGPALNELTSRARRDAALAPIDPFDSRALQSVLADPDLSDVVILTSLPEPDLTALAGWTIVRHFGGTRV
jgi:uroporphyrin-III C-methyltransferase / precorrin-2 dehydrogenase / sirohydrochlorin ferrochelatase